MALGPVIASIIFNFTNYTMTFIIFGAMIGLGSLIIVYYLPDYVNKRNFAV